MNPFEFEDAGPGTPVTRKLQNSNVKPAGKRGPGLSQSDRSDLSGPSDLSDFLEARLPNPQTSRAEDYLVARFSV
jgi:hypothetical protein